jgi:glycosyltransferase 2 family protein
MPLLRQRTTATICRFMSDSNESKQKKGLKQWAMFCLRWGIAIVGVWYVVAHMSLRDRAWVILDHASNRPQQVSLERTVGEEATQFPVIDPITGKELDVPREDVVNEPDQKTVLRTGHTEKSQLLGLDLPGDLDQHTLPRRLLVADSSTSPAEWISPAEAPGYVMKIPHPRDQIGLESMVRGARPSLLWAAIFIFPITFLITSYRWNELLKALDIHIGNGRTFVLNMVGAFYNTFMPGSTGGDFLKAYYASKQTPHRARAVMSVIVDRVVGLLALIVVGGVTASLQWEIPECRKVAIGAVVICIGVALGLLVFYNRTLHRISGLDFILRKLPMQKHVQAAVQAMHMYGERPLLGLWSLIVSFPVHGAVITSAMFSGLAFGLPLRWTYYWVAVPVIVLAGAIPISPQGAGVMEAFAVLLTRGQGVTVSQAFALTMSIRIVQILWNLTGGVFVLRGGYHAPTEMQKKELETDEDEPEPVAAQ